MRVRSSNTDEYGDPKSFKNHMIIGDLKDLTIYNGCEFLDKDELIAIKDKIENFRVEKKIMQYKNGGISCLKIYHKDILIIKQYTIEEWNNPLMIQIMNILNPGWMSKWEKFWKNLKYR